ncbi:MAG: thiamine pyrophosphate-binding protein [Novosphingobium sp.]
MPGSATSWSGLRPAAHAAEGYARSTSKPGVVLVTSGPGARQCRYRHCRYRWILIRW